MPRKMPLDSITCNALTTGQSLKHSSNNFWEHVCRVGYFRVTFIMCWGGLLWLGFTILDLEKLWLWRKTNIIKCDWRNIFLSKRIAAPVHMQSSSCHFDPKTAAPDELSNATGLEGSNSGTYHHVHVHFMFVSASRSWNLSEVCF